MPTINGTIFTENRKCLQYHYYSQISLFLLLCLTTFSTTFSPVSGFASNQFISGIKLSGNRIEDQTLFPEVKSTLGGRVELPCNLTLPSDDDAIQLIFWYRGNGTRAPLYTLDARTSLDNATHFSVDSRYDFRLAQPLANLVIDSIVEQDHGDYRCRVDFRWGRTINSFVSLHIIVPPKQVVIKDAVTGQEFEPNSVAGPYNEGTDVRLTCESTGGIPPPTLHWFRHGAMIDGSYAVGVNGSVWNELTIYRVGSANVNDEYVCQAGNFNSSSTAAAAGVAGTAISTSGSSGSFSITTLNGVSSNHPANVASYTNTPVQSSVRLDINLLPTSVKILSKNDTNRIIENRRLELRCQAYGSRPPATIKWYRNGVFILNGVSEHREPNLTTSTLILSSVSRRDNSAEYDCRAANPALPTQFLHDSTTLQVFYKPTVEIDVRLLSNNTKTSSSSLPLPGPETFPSSEISTSQSSVRLVAGVQAEVRCRIQSHPPPIAVQIFHNNRLLDQVERFDTSRDAIAGYRLVIGNVNSSHSGRYECLAKNREGSTKSNALYFDVQYIPYCDTNTTFPQKYSLAVNETLTLHCPIISNPPPTIFRWSWQDDDSAEYDSDEAYYKLTPHRDEDFGQLSCWTKNSLGEQPKRCRFVITRAKPPESLIDCRTMNRTTTSFVVECEHNSETITPNETPSFHAILFTTQQSSDSLSSSSTSSSSSTDLTSDVSPVEDLHNDNNISGQEGDSNRHRFEHIVQNLTSANVCRFLFNNLKPGTVYFVELWGSNKRGNSPKTRLSVDTMGTHNTKLISHSSSLQEIEVDPIYSAFFGAGIFGLGAIIVASFVSCRARRNQRQKQREEAEQIKQNFAFRTMSNVGVSDCHNKPPDQVDGGVDGGGLGLGMGCLTSSASGVKMMPVGTLSPLHSAGSPSAHSRRLAVGSSSVLNGIGHQSAASSSASGSGSAGTTATAVAAATLQGHQSVCPSLVQMALPTVLNSGHHHQQQQHAHQHHPQLEHHHQQRLLQPSTADIVFDNYSSSTHSESVFVIDNNAEMPGEVALQPFLISSADGTFHSLYHGGQSGLAPSDSNTQSLGSPYPLAPNHGAGAPPALYQLEQHHIEPTIIYHTIAQHFAPYDTTPMGTVDRTSGHSMRNPASVSTSTGNEDVKQSTV